MKRPSLKDFVKYVERYPKRLGLREIYKHYNAVSEEDKQKCRDAWELVVAGLKNESSRNESPSVRRTPDGEGLLGRQSDSDMSGVNETELPDG